MLQEAGETTMKGIGTCHKYKSCTECMKIELGCPNLSFHLHTPAPKPITKDECKYMMGIAAKESARTATIATLDIMERWIKRHTSMFSDSAYNELIMKIERERLRKSTTSGQDQHE